MAKFDWNGNGKKDNFDRFIEMKVISEVSKDEVDKITEDFDENDDLIEEESEDYDNDDTDEAIYQQVVIKKSTTIKEGDFQSELKKNMKTPEQVQKERGSVTRHEGL